MREPSYEKEEVLWVNYEGEQEVGKGSRHLMRQFPTTSCICCQGGNCFRLGHVSNCECICVRVREVFEKGEGEEWKQALEFKKRYVQDELERAELRKENEARGNSNNQNNPSQDINQDKNDINLVDVWTEKWEGILEEESDGSRREKWSDYRRRREEEKTECRRFQVKKDGTIREEKGCLREECPACWKWNEIRWKDSAEPHPFVPWHRQLLWCIDFWRMVTSRVRQGEHGRGNIEEVCKVDKVEWVASRDDGLYPGECGPMTEEEMSFGYPRSMVFPTTRRPIDYKLSLDENTEQSVCNTWFETAGIRIGNHLTTTQRDRIIRLLYTWRNLFISDTRQIPVTDLVTHAIPTYAGAKAHRAREVPATAEEEAWQLHNLPPMLGVIIGFTQSPWCAKTTFVAKKDSPDSRDPLTGFRSSLRMVHTYCALNDATIKSNYPMKRMEPIINGLAKESRRYFFSGDAANGYYAVAMEPLHAYKTAFNTVLGQCCYLRMGMGLTGAPHTYARLKDITFGPIPKPSEEISIHEKVLSYGNTLDFRYFFDDDYGAADDFDSLFSFLSDCYFPRMSWACLSLKPSKALFMMPSIEPLGLSIGPQVLKNGDVVQNGVKPCMRKLAKLRDYPIPQTITEVEQFLYLTLYLKMFIPGRVEHARVLKESCITELTEVVVNRVKKKQKIKAGFKWGDEQQASFEAIKEAVIWNACVGSDPVKRHYLATDVSKHGFGGIFFQLADEDEKKMSLKSPQIPKGKEKVIHYISQQFNDAGTRYPILEREALAVLRCLEDVRWIAVSSRYPIVVYTHQSALMNLLRGDDTKGRMAGWQIRLAEYDIEVRQTKGGEVNLATGLSRMLYEIMDPPTCQTKDWADILRLDISRKVRVEEIKDEYNRKGGQSGEKGTEGGCGGRVEEQGGERGREVYGAETGSITGFEEETLIAKKWAPFIEDPWYGEAVKYKLFGANNPSAKRYRKVKLEASKLVLIEDNIPRLGRYEKNQTLAECIRSHQVPLILQRLHDYHGHFATGVMSRNIIGKFYWPGRFQDIAKWCNTCDACQRLGPLRPSAKLSPIMQLQPMDMIGIDFIGPFNPPAEGGGRYIIIAVDYFSRYVWARVAETNHGYIVESFLQQDIVRRFGWPLAAYLDNGSHFVKGILPSILAKQGVKLFSAPITHPRSVGLSERYVQMILAGLRSKVLSDKRPTATTLWHEHLPEVLHAINTRLLRIHGYTPSQLFMGFNARMDAFDGSVIDNAMREILSHYLSANDDLSKPLEQQQYDLRMAQIAEMRELTRERVLQYQEEQEATYSKARYAQPQLGDLVLLRRFIVDKERGRKLEPRWEGPYLLSRIAKEGVSGYLQDMKTGKVKGRYGFDAMKVYVPREAKETEVVELDKILPEACVGWYKGRRAIDVSEWTRASN